MPNHEMYVEPFTITLNLGTMTSDCVFSIEVDVDIPRGIRHKKIIAALNEASIACLYRFCAMALGKEKEDA